MQIWHPEIFVEILFEKHSGRESKKRVFRRWTLSLFLVRKKTSIIVGRFSARSNLSRESHYFLNSIIVGRETFCSLWKKTVLASDNYQAWTCLKYAQRGILWIRNPSPALATRVTGWVCEKIAESVHSHTRFFWSKLIHNLSRGKSGPICWAISVTFENLPKVNNFP
jgi:hypothetical protein